MIKIVNSKIDCEQLLDSVQSELCGAAVLFVGTTRKFTDGRETVTLAYECYREMALKKMEQLRSLAMERWPIEKCAIVHRVGLVELKQASIAVAVSSPHRKDSFEAANWLVDTLKKEVPIWKQERWADGSTEWVHPNDANLNLDNSPNSAHFHPITDGVPTMMTQGGPDRRPLLDRFGRIHQSLRLSVTDRCNIRCFYCMPESVKFLPRTNLLSFEEIHQVVGLMASLGVQQVRITGGEPLVRSELWKLIELIRSIPEINDIGLTTNGILLANQAERLRKSGLDRLNISLDTVDEERFRKITRRTGLHQVLEGIRAAQDCGFDRIRINAVSIKGMTEAEIEPLANFCRESKLELRFIEFMPLDGDEAWENQQVLSGQRVREIIEATVGVLHPVERTDPSQPAIDYAYDDGLRVGFINSVTEPFCSTCNRLRLTAEGRIRNCLFANDEWDLREPIRAGADDAQLEELIRKCVAAKRLGHGSDSGIFVRPQRAMYQIGG